MREVHWRSLEQGLIILAEMGRAPIAGASCLAPRFDPDQRGSRALGAVEAGSYDLRPRMLGHPFQHLQRFRREAGAAVDAGNQEGGATEVLFPALGPLVQAINDS